MGGYFFVKQLLTMNKRLSIVRITADFADFITDWPKLTRKSTINYTLFDYEFSDEKYIIIIIDRRKYYLF